jgi:hypothetical protein
LSEEEVEELAKEIVKMKSGHQKIFQKKVREAREEEEQREARKRALKLEEDTEDKLAVIKAGHKLAKAKARGTKYAPGDKTEHKEEDQATPDKQVSLPPGKKFAYFASHKVSTIKHIQRSRVNSFCHRNLTLDSVNQALT